METQEELISQIKELIGANQTGKAIELLLKAQLSSLDKEVYLLNSRYNRMKDKQLIGTLDPRELQLEMNQINEALMDLSEKISRHKRKKPGFSTPVSVVEKQPRKLTSYMYIFPGILLIGVLLLWAFAGRENEPVKSLKEDYSAWQSAKEDNTPQSYEDYLAEFPVGEHKEEAETALQGFRTDMAEWNNTTRTGTNEAYKAYLNKFPDGLYKQMAAEQIKLLTDQKKEEISKKADQEAWKAAQANNSPDAYKTYIGTFPNGDHVAAAKSAIENFKKAPEPKPKPPIDGKIVEKEAPSLGLTVYYQKFQNDSKIILHTGLNNWVMLEDGGIVLKSNNKLGLAVQNKSIANGSKIILHELYDRWHIRSNGAIVLKNNPKFGLTVLNQQLKDYGEIILHEGYNLWDF